MNGGNTVAKNEEKKIKVSDTDTKFSHNTVRKEKSETGKKIAYIKRTLTNRSHNIKDSLSSSPKKATSETVEKDKNEPSRFLGEGVSYKAKLIGILEVSEARGDRMCQEALGDLKMAIRAAGEHKQRITINIAIDGLRLRDEKTTDCLYHHPVHKISFIAQDMADSRAFGYIFGSPDTGHRFFGIKTDKAASQVVISMRDLFQVVFELKKKEIEMAKQHLEQHQIKFGATLFSDLNSKSTEYGSSGSGKMRTIAEDVGVGGAGTSGTAVTSKASGGAKTETVVDLLDLELELNSIQQGIHQMERITPSDPFGPKEDPFGDSFTLAAKIPPPPPADSVRRGPSKQQSPAATTAQAQEKHWFDKETEALFDEEDPQGVTTTSQPSPPPIAAVAVERNAQDPPSSVLATSGTKEFDVFMELDPLGTGRSKPYIDKKDFFQDLKNPPKKVLKDLFNEVPGESSTPVFQVSFDSGNNGMHTEEVATSNITTSEQPGFGISFPEDPFDKTDPFAENDFNCSVCFLPVTATQDPFDSCFADFSSFKSISKSECGQIKANHFESRVHKLPLSVLDEGVMGSHGPLRVSLPPEKQAGSVMGSPTTTRKSARGIHKQNTVSGLVKLPSPKQKSRSRIVKQSTIEDRAVPIMEAVTLRNRALTTPSPPTTILLDAPEPPPRPAATCLVTTLPPPPLPPKRRLGDSPLKPPPRPPHSDYDYIENYRTPDIDEIEDSKSPPIPVPARRPRACTRPTPSGNKIEIEYYLTPFPLLPPPQKKNLTSPKSVTIAETLITTQSNTNSPKSLLSNTHSSLDITLSQLTKTGFSDLAASLNKSPTSLSKMTLHDLTLCLIELSGSLKTESSKKGASTVPGSQKTNILKSERYSALRESIEEDLPTFKAEFDAHFNANNEEGVKDDEKESLFDKYAVFRELLEQERTEIESLPRRHKNDEVSSEITFQSLENETETETTTSPANMQSVETISEDRYAALREISCVENSEDKEDVASDKDDSFIEVTKMDDDFDLLTSRPHSDSTESPTATLKEHQSIIETTIMEEDVSALEDEEPDEATDVHVAEMDSNIEKVLEPSQQNSESHSSSKEDVMETVPDKKNSHTPDEKSVIEGWAKFENDFHIEKNSSMHSEGNVSPWSVDSKDMNRSTYPPWQEQADNKKVKKSRRRRKHEDWQEDDESEDGWNDRRLENKSWSAPPWRENGWSDGDSLYDEPSPSYHGYHTQRRGRRRKISPWKDMSKDPSPWEDDESEDQQDWEGKTRWGEETRHRPKHRGSSWDDENRRHYEEPRRRRNSPWSGEGERKSSRESLTRDDDERYQRRNYVDRRRRRWEEQGYSRSREREREWREGLRRNNRYYKDRSYESPWEDEYSEHAEEESPLSQNRKTKWPREQRTRSCDKLRHYQGSEEDSFRDRRVYLKSSSRDEQSEEGELYGRHVHTLQSNKRINHSRKRSQNSPFEDDFSNHFVFQKVARSPDNESESDKKHSPVCVPDSLKYEKDYSEKQDEFLSGSPKGSVTTPKSSGLRTSPFDDDFTPPDTRRCSGRSFSSDTSDKVGREDDHRDDVFVSDTHEGIKLKNVNNISARPPHRRAESACEFSKRKGQGTVAFGGSSSDLVSELPANRHVKHDQASDNTITDVVSFTRRLNDRRQGGTDMKSRVSNLRRTDSTTSLRKSESVNIFARNSDPFDDDFFSIDPCTLPRSSKEDKMHHDSGSDSFKWTEAFNAFNFDYTDT